MGQNGHSNSSVLFARMEEENEDKSPDFLCSQKLRAVLPLAPVTKPHPLAANEAWRSTLYSGEPLYSAKF